MKYTLKLQRAIVEEYGSDFVNRKKHELCRTCLRYEGVRCHHFFLPITSDGADCPYYLLLDSAEL